MLRYPRIEVIKRIIYVPIYRESYEVQTMRPNRPMQSELRRFAQPMFMLNNIIKESVCLP